jgi:hypothetical protein
LVIGCCDFHNSLHAIDIAFIEAALIIVTAPIEAIVTQLIKAFLQGFKLGLIYILHVASRKGRELPTDLGVDLLVSCG